MEEVSTEALRKLAPRWTLAGDEKLLTMLQNTHQRLLARCQETNCQLDQMTAVLDDANIRLQNVNNQFMSLSSSQFIESRVYDDDADVTADQTPGKEVSVPSPSDELSKLKRSIAVIENNHEVITIMEDSDTSDTEDELPDRQVMKPKDMYVDRPLPYIIGSEPWKNKWHAGLVADDSDTDSSTSKVERDSDQYSHSEPEDSAPGSVLGLRDTVPVAHNSNLSESSAELPSEATSMAKPTPSDVASEIARRLGAVHLPPKLSDREPEYEEPTRPAVTKLYKPQEPVASTIFPDEPPPLDYQTDSDSDIFADLRRNQPYSQPYVRQDVAQDLFGRSEEEVVEERDIFSDFANDPPAITPTSLFEAGPRPHMFDKQHVATQQSARGQTRVIEQSDRSVSPSIDTGAADKRGVKKPVGGISLFGSNKGAESIGAAILRRNQQKSSSSDDGSESETNQPQPPKQQSKKEQDIFDNLFAINESKKGIPKATNVNDIKQEIYNKNEEKGKKDATKPIDLFSDNLFDDIDDIFTTNVVKTTKKAKSNIFEDDDGLFSEIAQSNMETSSGNKFDKKKSLFDSDDDLFSEKPSITNKPYSNKPSVETAKSVVANKVEPSKVVIPSGLFDDDDDDDDENMFSGTKTKYVSEPSNDTKQNVKGKKTFTNPKNVYISSSPSLFDDHVDDAKKLSKETIESPILTHQKIVGEAADKSLSKTLERQPKINNSNSHIFLNTSLNITKTKVFDQIDNVVHVLPSSVNTVLKENIRKASDSVLLAEETVPTENNDSKSIEHVSIKKSLEKNVYDSKANSKKSIDITKSVAINDMLNDSKISDGDFNQQDFDDVSTQKNKFNDDKNTHIEFDRKNKESSAIKSQNENNKSQINIQDNRENSLEDIFASPKDIQNKPKLETVNTENDNNTSNPDISSDILSEPPIFEKPKEPKKSKNVNALFDDDSDDEALFFKKDDIVSDENHEELTTTQDRLFGIFTDVPPEDDFNEINDDLNYDIFGTIPKPNVPNNALIEPSYPGDNMPVLDSKDENVNTVTHKVKPQQGRSVSVVTRTEEEIGDIHKLLNEEDDKILPAKKTTGIFNAIDEIFTQPDKLNSSTKEPDTDSKDDIFKRSKTSKSCDPYLLEDDDEGLFKSLPTQLGKSASTSSGTGDEGLENKSDDEQYQSLPNMETSNLRKGHSTTLSHGANYEKSLTETASAVEKRDKKVGKLKIGLNIDVKALLPGASPKKVKTADSTDGQTQSNVNIENEDSKLNEAVAFESKLDSEILDNKLSKERPRIQVKRRPSTRKARKEAVRKSGINFGDDSTDNSSSIDDPPRLQTDIQANITEKIINSNENDNVYNEEISRKLEEKVQAPSNTDNVDSIKPMYEPTKTEIQSSNVNTQDLIQPLRQPVKSTSTTKIVYILNDEDIFNTRPVETTNMKEQTNKENVVKNTESFDSSEPESSENFSTVKNVATHLVQSTNKSIKHRETDSEYQDLSFNQDSAIKTLGNTYATKGDENKTSLFGKEDHDEIFRNKKHVPKASIFDSDSDGELFGLNKKTEVKKVEKVQVKGHLFGDDDDDDDLFGIKPRKSIQAQSHFNSVPSSKETSTTTRPVFEDPLSMFHDEE